MTLDEAIKHAEEVAEKEERSANLHPRPDKDVKGSGKKYLSCLECATEHRQLAEWLKELKRLREKTDVPDTKWIPVSEKLPEVHQDVLLSLRSLDVVVGFRAAKEPYFYCQGDYIEPQNVLAWMPKPESYKAESRDK